MNMPVYFPVNRYPYCSNLLHCLLINSATLHILGHVLLCGLSYCEVSLIHKPGSGIL